MKKHLFYILFTFFALPCVAQKQVTDQNQVWLGYFNQTRLSTRWGIWLDLHARRIDFLDRWNTQIIRPGITIILMTTCVLQQAMPLPGTILRKVCKLFVLNTGSSSRFCGQAVPNGFKPNNGFASKSDITGMWLTMPYKRDITSISDFATF